MKLHEHIGRLRVMLGFKGFTSVILCSLALIMFGIFYPDIRPQTYDIKLFSIANNTIRSPKTVIDEEKTNEEKQKAAREVAKAYTYETSQVQNRVSLMNSIFDVVEEVNGKYEKQKESGKSSNKLQEEKLAKLKEILTENVSGNVAGSIFDNSFLALLSASPDDLDAVRSVVVSSAEEALGKKITEDDVAYARDAVAVKISRSALPAGLKTAAAELGKYAIVPNYVYDAKLTEKRKKQAMDSVEPVKILQGQVIVQEGHLIDRETYRQLELFGLLKNSGSIKPYIGLAVFVLLACTLLYLYVRHMRAPEETKQNRLVMAGMILLIALALMKLIGALIHLQIAGIEYVYPAAMAPMLAQILLRDRSAFLLGVLLAACASIEFHGELADMFNAEMVVYALLSGTAGILLLLARLERTRLFKTGISVALFNMLAVCFIYLLNPGQMAQMDFLYSLLFAFLSGILSAVLTMGLQPFFEAAFGILSPMRLIELSNPNHPLLKKILIEAPGTYHHSLMVANLSEAACEAIGANGPLARVGSYYHDIGKTKRPQFFIENQMNTGNPHDRLEPEVSRDIIFAHTKDGAEMLKNYRLPKALVYIAEQHHGTTCIKYFYSKAKKKSSEVKEEDYRYSGPKPQTKEAAVINIADSVEAAVRRRKKFKIWSTALCRPA
ncbi:cyclic-di-AMP phosphodiesterase PgpH [Weizmannia acidilactici]|nr:HDIG domain-containing metalloprotein [Weizmannia acidilactici]GER66937.1 cyclic-di-AMP phosphodiesterase PgpH [Weizmannia acidilactici]